MESSPQVNLYIETTVHGPRQQGGRWMYLLEFVTRRGDPVTLWKVGDWEAEKENVLIMQALSAALDRLPRKEGSGCCLKNSENLTLRKN